jgi:hypothetical protein
MGEMVYTTICDRVIGELERGLRRGSRMGRKSDKELVELVNE